MGFSPFFFRANKNMLNKRSDKLELLRIAEAVALEKSIDKELIIDSMETGIAKAAKSKFGQDNEIKVLINRDSGDIGIFRKLIIVENTENVRIDAGGASWFNGGNIGIGRTNMAAKLDIKGDGGLTGLTNVISECNQDTTDKFSAIDYCTATLGDTECKTNGKTGDSARIECSKCDRGKYSKHPALPCNECPIGWYNNEFGKTTCDKCMPGYYNDLIKQLEKRKATFKNH